MKNKKKLFLLVLISSIFIYFFIYNSLLSLFFFNINGEFLYNLKNILGIKESVNNNIIIVEIDDLTYNKLGFPIDRGDYIPFLDNLKKSSPAVIGLDILFLDKGKNKKNDKILASKFGQLENIVLGFDIKKDDKNNNNIVLPYIDFYKNVTNFGYYIPTTNSKTNKVYSLKPFYNLEYNGKKNYYESFCFSLLRYYYNYIFSKNDKEIKGNDNGKIYNFFGKNIPIKQEEFIINFLPSNAFYKESFYNIYIGNFDKKFFKDKIIIIGSSAEGVKDDFLVPSLGKIKGVYVHANAINNILNDNYVIYFNTIIEHLISFLFIFFIVYLNIFHLRNLSLRFISLGVIFLFLIIIIIYFFIFYFSYKNSGIYLLPNYPFEFVTILFLSFFVSSILKYLNEDKNKRLLSKALSEYVSLDIASEILNSTGNVNLSGENKKITIFFSDIEGFTTMSEKLSPEELVAFLRIYLKEMSLVIMDNKGFINKYEGDAIMALWGVFGQVEKFGVIDACTSALLQQKKLKILNEKLAQEQKRVLNIRMGLHMGNAIIGNIGAEGRKMEFTALGDSVNLASRLEGVNKFYSTNICVSENVYNEAKNHFAFRYLDKIRVKGKNIGINIYELIDNIEEVGIFKENIIKDFEEAVSLYMQKDFAEAKIIFEKLSNLGDSPSKIYIKRCEIYINNPPLENWDGVWIMEEK